MAHPKKLIVRVKDEEIDDLKSRLRNTRWPDELEGAGWDYGSDLNYIKVRQLQAYILSARELLLPSQSGMPPREAYFLLADSGFFFGARNSHYSGRHLSIGERPKVS
jgi:hypothetical protein